MLNIGLKEEKWYILIEYLEMSLETDSHSLKIIEQIKDEIKKQSNYKETDGSWCSID